MLGLKLNHVSKRGHWWYLNMYIISVATRWQCNCHQTGFHLCGVCRFFRWNKHILKSYDTPSASYHAPMCFSISYQSHNCIHFSMHELFLWWQSQWWLWTNPNNWFWHWKTPYPMRCFAYSSAIFAIFFQDSYYLNYIFSNALVTQTTFR